ncbi:acireductone dioxygenase 1 [Dermatophagoides pteronyssinus]|uniref:acireductone dioxygenase 1 n=1 Tax=Dermatophagoides pteronyssinus TaxID=6956 RepID=UPI003F6631DE
MVQAWYMNDNDNEDQRSERHLSPPNYIDIDELKTKTGILYWNIDADNYKNDENFQKIRQERGYDYQDELEISKTKIDDYENKLKIFFTEHLHSDEEIRFCLNGSGYFDVRDRDDRWIRIKIGKNDLLILPAGIYHRFTLDHNDYIKVVRLFTGQPCWTAINRPADDHPSHQSWIRLVEATK